MRYSKAESRFLTFLGREAIEHYLDTKRYISLVQVKKSDNYQEILSEKKPLFVVIRSKHNGKTYVRGEAGVFDPDMQLGELIVQTCVHAAFFDPKTPRMKPYELNEIYLTYIFPGAEEPLTGNSLQQVEKQGVRALFRGRSMYILPYQWKEFESPDQMKKYIELSLGVKGTTASEVEYSSFSCTEVVEKL